MSDSLTDKQKQEELQRIEDTYATYWKLLREATSYIFEVSHAIADTHVCSDSVIARAHTLRDVINTSVIYIPFDHRELAGTNMVKDVLKLHGLLAQLLAQVEEEGKKITQ